MKILRTTIAISGYMLLAQYVCAQTLLQGTSSGIFVNPDGPAGSVSTGQGTSTISWGTASSAGDFPSSLSFSGQSFGLTLDIIDPIGSLLFTNGVISGDSGIESVDLSLSLDLTLPSGQVIAEAFTFGLDNTSNSSNEEASSDVLRLLTPYGGSGIDVGDDVLALRLFFGEAGNTAVSEFEQVFLLEGRTTEIPINAVLCRTLSLTDTETSFTFSPVGGGTSLVLTGEGTNFITTGESDQPTEYEVSGLNTSGLRTEIPFVAGSLRYFNGSTGSGTAAEAAILNVDIGDLGVFSFDLEFTLTTNTNDARESADIISVTNPISNRTVEIDGIPHVARILFANPETGGFTNVSQFAVEENVSASADVLIVLTRFLPDASPLTINISMASPGELLLSWNSVVGRSYQLESGISLDDFTPDGGQITASNTSVLVTRNIEDSVRFYRVVELPTP